MALVEVARFLDLTEAQAAAAALRASDIPVFLQNENWGQTEAYLQLAMGGFRIWAPEEEAAAARDFIADCRARPSDAPPRGGDVPAVGAVGLWLLAPVLGWFVLPFLRRRGRLASEDEV